MNHRLQTVISGIALLGLSGSAFAMDATLSTEASLSPRVQNDPALINVQAAPELRIAATSTRPATRPQPVPATPNKERPFGNRLPALTDAPIEGQRANASDQNTDRDTVRATPRVKELRKAQQRTIQASSSVDVQTTETKRSRPATQRQTKANRAQLRAQAKATAVEQRSEFKAKRASLESSRTENKKQFSGQRSEIQIAARARALELKTRYRAATTDQERAAIKQEAAVARSQYQDQRAALRVSTRASVVDTISARSQLVSERLEVLRTRAEQIITRVAAANENDIQSVTDSLARARISLAASVTAHEQAEARIEAISAESTTEQIRTALADAKASYKTSQEAIKSAYSDTRAAVGSLRASVTVSAQVNQ